ncbi:hypothetical protein B0O99DRAFT_694581 [Bisporella sp. PMI_857]|nr:hypothetical protein B0O99DRAFT_694581 [Bisporella sp. PMI_857]
MDIILGYAIALSGIVLARILLAPLVIKLRSGFFRLILTWIISLLRSSVLAVYRYIKYFNVVGRNAFWGPWTITDIIFRLAYIAANSFCIGFRVSVTDFAKAGLRAGNLSIINLMPLFLGPHLSFTADILGVSLTTLQAIHRSAGFVTFGLVLFHAIVAISYQKEIELHNLAHVSAVVGGSSLGMIIVLSWPFLRRRFYEVFLRLHQFLAAATAVSILLHIPSKPFPRMYLYITGGIFSVTTAIEALIFLYYNGLFQRGKTRKMPRVGEIFKLLNEDDNGPIQLTIDTQTPLKIDAGQYINIFIPSLGVRSIIQSHPFVVTSWTGKEQTKLELLIEPRRGWTRKLQSRAVAMSRQNGGLGRVLFTGPHGAIVPIGDYQYILMIATGYGITAQLPLLERLVQGTLAREVRARRVCLVWEFENIGIFNAVRPLLNWLLLEDSSRDLAFFTSLAFESDWATSKYFNTKFISRNNFEIRDSTGPKRKWQEDEAVEKVQEMRRREIERCREEKIMLPLSKEIGREESKENIYEETLPICTKLPQMLITISASTKIRDELRTNLRPFVKTDITLTELDYQPDD